MTYLILGMGTGELILILGFILTIIVITSLISYKIGKNAGENKAYKNMLNNNSKSAEIIRLEKLLTDKIISQEEFETLKNKLK